MDTNFKDMNKSVELLTQMLEMSHVAISDTLATTIQSVIDEWTVHMGPDVEQAIRDISDLRDMVANLEDERKANDVLEEKLNDRDEEIDSLQDEVRSLRDELQEIE